MAGDLLDRDGPPSVMVRVNGHRFRCEECGANVFTEHRPLRYECNGCGARYMGEAKED